LSHPCGWLNFVFIRGGDLASTATVAAAAAQKQCIIRPVSRCKDTKKGKTTRENFFLPVQKFFLPLQS
jgi:hypothetical protein